SIFIKPPNFLVLESLVSLRACTVTINRRGLLPLLRWQDQLGQGRAPGRGAVWHLVIGAFLGFGLWDLELTPIHGEPVDARGTCISRPLKRKTERKQQRTGGILRPRIQIVTILDANRTDNRFPSQPPANAE